MSNAISLLEKNQDKIFWCELSQNPNAISILEKNQDKIFWDYLCENKGYYELNYKFLKERMDIIREDLMKAVLIKGDPPLAASPFRHSPMERPKGVPPENIIQKD